MKGSSLIFTLIFCLNAFFGLEAAALHVLLIGDTTDASIGVSAEMDLCKMSRQIKKIADSTGLKLRQTVISGEKVLPKNVLQAVDGLEFDTDDVAIFYYSGHGYRTEDKRDNCWPNLYFSLTDEGLDLLQMCTLLEQKQPRFLIVLADVCNSFIPNEHAPLLIRKFFDRSTCEEMIAANYRSLFLEMSGTLLACSSVEGEFSWGTDSGGLFTTAFLQHLDRSVRTHDYPDWEVILQKTAANVADVQHPYWVWTPVDVISATPF